MRIMTNANNVRTFRRKRVKCNLKVIVNLQKFKRLRAVVKKVVAAAVVAQIVAAIKSKNQRLCFLLPNNIRDNSKP